MNEILLDIGQLVLGPVQPQGLVRGAAMQAVEAVPDAWLAVSDGRVEAWGRMADWPADRFTGYARTDARGRVVLPGFVDSHTHLIFGRTREGEFVRRLRGETYEQIAAAGGGILNSARHLAELSEDELLEGALARVQEITATGTTCFEVKTGYGLLPAQELKLLRVAHRLRAAVPHRVRITLLAAHALPADYRDRRHEFLDRVCTELVPAAAAIGADYIDVFCEIGFFTPEETERVLRCGADHGLAGRVHANELDFSGGVEVGVRCGARSVDHLECVGDEQIAALLASETIPTVLPGTALFLGLPYAPARRMIDSGLGMALASDYNPGTCPTGNMGLIWALACVGLRLLPEEALVAATANGAAALDWAVELGRLRAGFRADLLLTRPIESFHRIPYSFGSNLIDRVMIGGEWWTGSEGA